MAEEKTFSAKQIATRIGTESKILRKFFRDPKSGYDAVGQGGRYDFPESELPKIKAAFDEWNKGKTRRQRPTNAQRALAEKAGIVPRARQEAEKAEPRPRPRRSIAAPNPLEQDDLMTRCRESIGERAARHGVTVKQGQWAPVKKPISAERARKIIPGLSPKDFDPVASAEAAAQLEPVSEEDLNDLFEEALHEVLEGTDHDE